MRDKRILIEKFFEETKFVKSNIDSYNSFIEWRMQKVVNAEKELMPAVIPVDAEEVKFEFGELTLSKPIIIEADGSERPLYPTEARMRNLTYSAPAFLEIALIVDGKERDRAEVKIAEIPVMVKSKLCYLSELSPDELVESGEDPMDPGGYFIVNGTERALVLLEDLAPNQINVNKEKTGPITHTAKVFSAIDTYKISHAIERTKEGIFQASFSNVKKVPFTVLMKALGMTKDKDIADAVGFEELPEDLYVNLVEFMSVTTQEEAKEFISKSLQLALPKERKLQKIESILDSIFLPHLGTDKKARLSKAHFLAQMVRKIVLLRQGTIAKDDKDHYMNKRIRMAGDLLED
ncbi:MAG: DNA-directed RNA polymerase subunit B'', partial [Candidatus Nanoarchaeia archaeon]|nr:DNA-directed RNA polymerase subunit B'' [Candidatus Nanoarchaeia archaeon]